MLKRDSDSPITMSRNRSCLHALPSSPSPPDRHVGTTVATFAACTTAAQSFEPPEHFGDEPEPLTGWLISGSPASKLQTDELVIGPCAQPMPSARPTTHALRSQLRGDGGAGRGTNPLSSGTPHAKAGCRAAAGRTASAASAGSPARAARTDRRSAQLRSQQSVRLPAR